MLSRSVASQRTFSIVSNCRSNGRSSRSSSKQKKIVSSKNAKSSATVSARCKSKKERKNPPNWQPFGNVSERLWKWKRYIDQLSLLFSENNRLCLHSVVGKSARNYGSNTLTKKRRILQNKRPKRSVDNSKPIGKN